jgi:hypothetical protein
MHSKNRTFVPTSGGEPCTGFNRVRASLRRIDLFGGASYNPASSPAPQPGSAK